MDFYSELKSRNEILSVANGLGYNGTRSGTCYQGDCPRHPSAHGICLVIWPKIQGFKCYHCGASGDVIDLVMLYKKLDHKGAVKYLADRAGIPLYGKKELSPEEVAQREADANEKVLVENMLTEAAGWYHQQLKNYPKILDHLRNHYGFSQEIIDELKIGFAPPVQEGSDSPLARHLNSIPEFQGKLYLSGLFVFKILSGPYTDFFNGRIVFPYWKAGKVVYMTARATDLTPVNPHECYPDKEGKVKLDDQGKPTFIKYKKLLTHNPESPMRMSISKFIQNETFMGEDTIRGEKEVIITEGAPDWVSAVDKGFAAISPVTTRFREEDHEKLAELTAGAESIYIINDNEENQAGRDGALDTAQYLTQKGKNVFLVELPRPEGKDKIDLNEYFLDHQPEDLRSLMNSSKSLLDILIDDLPGDFIKAQSTLREEIAPLLIELDEAKLEHYLGVIRKKTKTNRKALDAELEAARNAKREELFRKEEIKIDPEVEKEALAISQDPLLFKKRIDAVNQAGVVGERGTVAMYFCALDSRLLPEDNLSPNVLAIKNAGHFGAGKSYTLTTCLQIYPNSAYFLMTNGSGKSIFFLKGGLKHKALIVTEGFQFQANNAADSELVYSVRSILSEGRVSYWVVEKDEKTGHLATIEKKVEGPTSFITTTVMETLEAQFEDRLFTIHPDESVDQTKRIIMMIMAKKAGKSQGLDQKTIDSWKRFHESLKPVDVLIPFAEDIGRFITRDGEPPISTRRASNRVMTVIQSIACAYQHQRQRDSRNRVIAEIADYWMAYQVVQDAFRENMGAQDKKTEQYLTVIQEKGRITPGNLAKIFRVSGAAISGWAWKSIQAGMIEWCDENGYYFVDEKALKKAKHQGRAYLKISDTYQNETVKGLPTPFDLTQDSRWDEGGDLLKSYDLQLEKPTVVRSDLDGVKPFLPVFTPAPNTVYEDEIVNIIEYSGEEPEGVNVLTQIHGGEGKTLEKPEEEPRNDRGNGNQDSEPENGHGLFREEELEGFDEQTKALAEEFAPFMNPKTVFTPHLCRKGCKHYDSVGDEKSVEFREFCWKSEESRIERGIVCKKYENKNPNLPEGVLRF